MTTIMLLCESNIEQELHDAALRAAYLQGGCGILAIAIHRGTDWPLVALYSNDKFVHVGVRSPDGFFHDARGAVSPLTQDFGRPFGVSMPYELRSISESDLDEDASMGNHNVRYARLFAEKLWPDFPWKTREQEKIRAFGDALEALCREHGYWIRPVLPGCPPIVEEAHGDEGGYTLRPTSDNLSYTLTRDFISENIA